MTQPAIKITAFQALTRLADVYRGDLDNVDKYRHIMALYLQGVQSSDDQEVLENLLQDAHLSDYSIVVMHDDPVRREFECELARRTLLESLDVLDSRLLEQHVISISEPQVAPDPDVDADVSGTTTPDEDTDKTRDVKRQLLKASIVFSYDLFSSLPTDGTSLFDLFHQPMSIPISAISSTFFIQLGTLTELLRLNQCVYAYTAEASGYVFNKVQLMHFICSLIAYDVSRRSDYDLDTFFCTLNMPEVRHAFDRVLPGFVGSLNFKDMFQTRNAPTFDEALVHTIKINQDMLDKKKRIQTMHAGSIALDLPHRNVSYMFFSSHPERNQILAKYTGKFQSVQREVEQQMSAFGHIRNLSLVVMMLCAARILDINLLKKRGKRTEDIKDISMMSLFTLSSAIGIFTECVLDSCCESPRSNLVHGMP